MGSEYILKNARVIDPARGIDAVGDIGVADGVVVEASEVKNPAVIDLTGLVLSPGFIDLHVHLRQPGNNMAETIASGTMAAAKASPNSSIVSPTAAITSVPTGLGSSTV